MLLRSSVLLLASACPAFAWHIAGTVYCDQNDSHTIDGPDTPLANYTANVTSQVVSPGTSYTDLTDASGFYSVGLLDDPDTYTVTITPLPGGQTIRIPGGGSYTITLDLNQDHRDGVDFLIGGCAPPTTTMTSTTGPGTTQTTPTTSSTTTTTLGGGCPAIPFIVCEGGKINNDSDILVSVAANAPGALLRLSQHSFMSNGTSVIADHVEIGDDSDIFEVRTNDLHRGSNVTIRSGVVPPPAFPLMTPCCPIPAIACSGDSVVVPRGETMSLGPGSYGALRVPNDSQLDLAPGTYTFCSIRLGRSARILAQGPVTLNVEGSIRVGVDSHLEPVPGQPPLVVNAAGKKIKLTQNAVARASFTAPNAQLRLGRNALFEGEFCVGTIKTDKHITLQCP